MRIPFYLLENIFVLDYNCRMNITNKKLCEMTLSELWQLFPIFLTEHNTHWADWYAEEVATLKSILPPETVYCHIGSTAVSGIMAKPIIDILIVVNSTDRMKQAASRLQSNGYIVMSTAENRIAKDYEQLKLRLWKQYEHDRDGYTKAKTEFVQKHTALAKQN